MNGCWWFGQETFAEVRGNGEAAPMLLKKCGFEVVPGQKPAIGRTGITRASSQVAEVGVGTAISLASLRRFWAVAAR